MEYLPNVFKYKFPYYYYKKSWWLSPKQCHFCKTYVLLFLISVYFGVKWRSLSLYDPRFCCLTGIGKKRKSKKATRFIGIFSIYSSKWEQIKVLWGLSESFESSKEFVQSVGSSEEGQTEIFPWYYVLHLISSTASMHYSLKKFLPDRMKLSCNIFDVSIRYFGCSTEQPIPTPKIKNQAPKIKNQALLDYVSSSVIVMEKIIHDYLSFFSHKKNWIQNLHHLSAAGRICFYIFFF